MTGIDIPMPTKLPRYSLMLLQCRPLGFVTKMIDDARFFLDLLKWISHMFFFQDFRKHRMCNYMYSWTKIPGRSDTICTPMGLHGQTKNVARLPKCSLAGHTKHWGFGNPGRKKIGWKMSGNTPAPMDGASGGSMGGESGQMNGGCPGCMGCGMGPMGCPCGGCNMGCPCGGMGCPCGGMMMPMMMQLGLFFSECRVPEKEENKESGSDDDLIFQAGKKSLPLPNSFFVKLQTSDYETESFTRSFRKRVDLEEGRRLVVFALKLSVFASTFGAGNENCTALTTRPHSKGDCWLQGWLLTMEKSFLPKKGGGFWDQLSWKTGNQDPTKCRNVEFYENPEKYLSPFWPPTFSTNPFHE